MKKGYLSSKQGAFLIKQALFGNTLKEQIAALILLAQNRDPEGGWLLESLLEAKSSFPISGFPKDLPKSD